MITNPPIRGLALAHALASTPDSTTNTRLAATQERLILQTIADRGLTGLVARAPSRSPTNTKLARAREIYEQYGEECDRGRIIEMFVDELGLTKAGATTYYSKLRSGD